MQKDTFLCIVFYSPVSSGVARKCTVQIVTTISPSVFLSKCESRLRDERASKDPENVYSGMPRREFYRDTFLCPRQSGPLANFRFA